MNIQQPWLCSGYEKFVRNKVEQGSECVHQNAQNHRSMTFRIID